jgi:hypothetical protein
VKQETFCITMYGLCYQLLILTHAFSRGEGTITHSLRGEGKENGKVCVGFVISI